ncbi:hypothetical protein ENSA5_02910 [Enhygromyxa salina]|uniref:Lipoprotein n=1 Tax=Enhygromyxa salina TaxID=215803 RepID=A0A2S9YJQ0_9BACT|nr:hypothetical protein [Enhygromyxa salina]PRQ05301.1 hypothetical protein ENSA5_02910 [Enhygromyxa salina]
MAEFHQRPNCTRVDGTSPSMRVLQLLLILATACADDGDGAEHDDEAPAKGPFEVQYHTEYVDIAPGFSQPVCRGSLDEIDRHVEATAELLDIDVQERITLFWYNQNAAGSLADISEICEWCSGCGGCYNGVAHIRLAVLYHELVHAVVAPVWGWSDTLFAEGVAMGLDRNIDGYGSGISTIYNLDLLSSTMPSDVAGSGMHGGAHFSRWLIDRFGPGKFSEMFDRLSMSASKEEVFAAVEEVYGLPFEELEAEYYATAPLAYPLPGLCEGHVNVPWNGDRWELSASSDCDEPHMFGPADDGGMYAVVTMDIPPEYVEEELAVWVPSDVGANVWPCLDEPMYDVDPTFFGAQVIHNSLSPPIFRAAGRYRIEMPVYDSGDIYLRLCVSNGKHPSHYPVDRTVDPENCLGD